MIVAAHQPHYLPWLGYFHKMASCDLFIYLDDVQFKKREFQNRNKIRVKNGVQWLTAPVATKGRYDQNISDVLLTPGAWAHDHWTALQLAYGRAPFFKTHEPVLKKIYGAPWQKLVDVCGPLNEWHRQALGIATPLRFSSEFGVRTMKSQRLVDLCRAVGADAYLSGAGARDYLEEDLFTQAGIRVQYQDYHHPVYAQAYPGFESHLAALDLIFNLGPGSKGVMMGQAEPPPKNL